jgi:hypothetical protein
MQKIIAKFNNLPMSTCVKVLLTQVGQKSVGDVNGKMSFSFKTLLKTFSNNDIARRWGPPTKARYRCGAQSAWALLSKRTIISRARVEWTEMPYVLNGSFAPISDIKRRRRRTPKRKLDNRARLKSQPCQRLRAAEVRDWTRRSQQSATIMPESCLPRPRTPGKRQVARWRFDPCCYLL